MKKETDWKAAKSALEALYEDLEAHVGYDDYKKVKVALEAGEKAETDLVDILNVIKATSTGRLKEAVTKFCSYLSQPTTGEE